MAYHTGYKINPGQFSRENCEPGVDDYIEGTISDLSNHRWRTLMELWGRSRIEVPAFIAEGSRARRKLYLPPSSSPAKE